MRRISTPGKDDEGSILLDVLVSLVIITLTIFPFYRNYYNLLLSGEKQRATLQHFAEVSMEASAPWIFERKLPDEE